MRQTHYISSSDRRLGGCNEPPHSRSSLTGACWFDLRNTGYNFYENVLPNWHTDERGRRELERIVERIKRQGKRREFDCIMGVSGGIVPCWDAIAMLGLAISAGRMWLGLPMLLAFSAGLATVLVLLGVAVVGAKHVTNLAAPSSGRLQAVARALPLVSAALVTLMGMWLCYEALNPH